MPCAASSASWDRGVAPEPPAAGTFLELIDQLEELVTTATRLPFTANVVVNEDEILDVIDRARLGLPEELVQARHTLEDGERVIAAAEAEAEAIVARGEESSRQLVAQAGDHAQGLIADHAILAQAQVRAETVVAEAEAQAAAVRAEADAYARDVMIQLEEQLNRAMGTVRKGLEALPKPQAGRRRKQG